MLATGAAAQEQQYRHPVADGNLSIQEGLDPAWKNILLLGADTRRDKEIEGRSDAMIICSINMDTGAVRLTSLARDMWVNIAGTQVYDRINTAFRYGGPELAIKTVNELLLLNIEHYVAVNFYGICDVVDAIGGIDLELTRAEVSTVNQTTDWDYGSVKGKRLVYKEDGCVTLCGAQALAYARIRKLDNDLGRNNRQRNVLAAVAQKAMSLPLHEQMSFIKESFGHVTTDLGMTDIVSLGMAVLSGGLEEIEQLSLPSDFQYKNESGRSVLSFDTEQAREELHGFVYHKPSPISTAQSDKSENEDKAVAVQAVN